MTVTLAPVLVDRLRRCARFAVMTLIVVAVCAAAFNGFHRKWGFREGSDTRYSAQAYFDGTGARPFAYRRLIPDIVNWVVPAAGASASDKERANTYRAKIVALYILSFGGFLAMAGAAYALARQQRLVPSAALLAACATVAIFPLLQIGGGYFYDMWELAFFLLFILYAQRARLDILVLLAVLGTWNKESFLFFILAAAPLLHASLPKFRFLAALAVCGAASCLTYAVSRMRFAHLPGSTVESHIADQAAFFLDWTNMFRVEEVYGLILPHPFSLIGLACALSLVLVAWPNVSGAFRRYAAAAAIVNLPLFILFCAPGEVRNLSMLFPLLPILIGASLTTIDAADRKAGLSSARARAEAPTDSKQHGHT